MLLEPMLECGAARLHILLDSFALAQGDMTLADRLHLSSQVLYYLLSICCLALLCYIYPSQLVRATRPLMLFYKSDPR